jgi:hypothetical protein
MGTSVFIVGSLTGEGSDTLLCRVNQHAAANESQSTLNVVVEKAIRFRERNRLAEFGMRRFNSFTSFERMNEIQGLGGTHQFDGQNSFRVFHYLQELGRTGCAHRNVVLLTKRGWNGINRSRMGEDFVF